MNTVVVLGKAHTLKAVRYVLVVNKLVVEKC